ASFLSRNGICFATRRSCPWRQRNGRNNSSCRFFDLSSQPRSGSSRQDTGHHPKDTKVTEGTSQSLVFLRALRALGGFKFLGLLLAGIVRLVHVVELQR